MEYNLHTANLVSRFTQAQLQLSKQLVKCNKAMRCGFNTCATTCTKQMAAISRSLAEAKFASSFWKTNLQREHSPCICRIRQTWGDVNSNSLFQLYKEWIFLNALTNVCTKLISVSVKNCLLMEGILFQIQQKVLFMNSYQHRVSVHS